MLSQAAALFVLLQASQATVMLAACAVYGFSIGNMITFPPLIIQREIGHASFGADLVAAAAVLVRPRPIGQKWRRGAKLLPAISIASWK
jgi:hypothetical protein